MDRGGSGGRGERMADGLHLHSKVGNEVISCEGGRELRGGGGEERREHGKQFPRVGG